MLDLRKKYYVSAGSNLRSIIESWANKNTMKLIGEDVSLPTCSRAYELDVQHNEDLKVAMRLLGSGRPNFMNGKRTIGKVMYDKVCSVQCVIVYPEIEDR